MAIFPSILRVIQLIVLLMVLLMVLIVLPSFLPLNSAALKSVTKTVVFIGDSLTAGYGVKKIEAYPEVIGRLLQRKGREVRIVNGGISGSVTGDADRRVQWFLKTKPDVLVLALGANDALKGTPIPTIKKNLARAIDLARSKKIPVLLCGMQIFANFGPEYRRDFETLFRDLAREKHVALLPFLLEGVALDKALNQVDGKHPNAKGHEVVAKRVLAELEKLL